MKDSREDRDKKHQERTQRANRLTRVVTRTNSEKVISTLVVVTREVEEAIRSEEVEVKENQVRWCRQDSKTVET